MRPCKALIPLLLLLVSTVSEARVPESRLPSDTICQWLDPLFPPLYAALDSFWIDSKAYYGDVKQKPSDPDFHYWRNAHVIDILLDAYERTGDSLWLARVDRLVSGIYRANGERWRNNYYDDMEWMALALLRASDLSGEERYYKIARLLWQDITMGWNSSQGGGIAWKKDQREYKNTPANMPACILASRLFRRDALPDDLEWALKLFEWQRLHLVDPETGVVWDGVNRTGDGKIDKEWKFSYCQGVYIGAAVELFRITGRESYLDQACRTADGVVSDTLHFTVSGILRSEGTGDGGLFKGIFVRYLAQLIQFGKLDSERNMRYRNFLVHNASVLISTYQNHLYLGDRWDMANPATLKHGLGTQVSGMMLLEAVSALCRQPRLEQPE
ncbi:MAG: glycoside hydrolase family 76 protein [Bacteroidales bacterium]